MCLESLLLAASSFPRTSGDEVVLWPQRSAATRGDLHSDLHGDLHSEVPGDAPGDIRRGARWLYTLGDSRSAVTDL